MKEVTRLTLPPEPTQEVFTETELIVILVFGFLALLLVLLLVVVAVYCCNPAKRKKWLDRKKTKSKLLFFYIYNVHTFISLISSYLRRPH